MKRKLLSFLLILCLLLPYAASAQEGGSLLLEESGGISSLGSSDGLIQSRDAQISIPQLQTMTDVPVQQLQPPSHEPFDITASATAALQEPQTRAAGEFDRSTFNTVTVPKIQNGAGEQKGLSSGEESISPYSGNLTLCYDDLTLPGRNGFDLTIGRTYQTSQATVGQPYVMQAPNNWANPDQGPGPLRNLLYWRGSNYLLDRYNLGVGWSFNFPSVEIAREYEPVGSGDTYRYDVIESLYYHTGSGEAYEVEFTSDETDSNLKKYDKKDVVFRKNDTGYSNGQETSYYSLTAADQTKQYFAADGRLLGMVDRFENEIRFEHTPTILENGVPNGTFSYDDSFWTLSTPSEIYYDDTKGRYDSTSVRVRNPGQEDPYIKSFPIQVEPGEKYQIGGSFLSPDGDRIRLEVLCYDAGYQLRDTKTETINLNPSSQWQDISREFTMLSSTRYVQVKVVAVGGASNLNIDNVFCARPNPLITKITDSVGRVITFLYGGNFYDLQTRRGDITVTVQDPYQEYTKTLTYQRYLTEFEITSSVDPDWKDERMVWYLGESDTVGMGDAYNVSYSYSDVVPELRCDVFSKTESSNDPKFTRPVLTRVNYQSRQTYYTYGLVRKHCGEDGYMDDLRILGRYDQTAVADSEGRISFTGDLNHVDYTYSGTYNGNSFNNETGYPNYTFDEESNLNETYTVTESGLTEKQSVFSNAKLQSDTVLASGVTTKNTYTYDDVFENSIALVQTDVTQDGTTKTTYQETAYNDWGGIASQTLPMDAAIRASKKDRYTISYYNSEDGPQVSETVQYDTMGRKIGTTSAAGVTTLYSYTDPSYPGNLTSKTIEDPMNLHHTIGGDALTTYTYDDLGLFVAEETVYYGTESSTTTTEYDYLFGNPLKVTAPNGAIALYAYDMAGRPVAVVSPGVQGESGQFYYQDIYEYTPYMGFGGYGDNILVTELTVQAHFQMMENSNSLCSQTYTYSNALGQTMAQRQVDLEDPKGDNIYGATSAIYLYDTYGRLTGYSDSAGRSQAYTYEHAIIGTSDENLVKSRVSELVPFLFCQRASTIHL